MKITTETGSVYTFGDNGFCVKTNSKGERIDVFKAFVIKPVPDEVTSLAELYDLPTGDPIIGQRVYISGLDIWWISTRVVSVEE